MGENITALLASAGTGDRQALDRVFAKIYPELKRLAQNRLTGSHHTITPTGLVNEVYERFAKDEKLSLQNRAHFLACAAKAMRQIVVDFARRAKAEKRGKDWKRITFTEDLPREVDQFLELDVAMGELAELDNDLVQLVELKFFGGLTNDELAELRGTSARTVGRDWKTARAFLHSRLD